MFASLLILLLSAHSFAGEASFSPPSLKANSTCADMRQNLVDLLDRPINGAAQQGAKFSIINLRMKAYSDVCGAMDQLLADKIFQSF